VSSSRNRIKELRGLRGLTLKDVADVVGVSPRTVNRWERGEVEVPRKHWETLADLFHVEVAWMLAIEVNGDEDEMQEAC
jgi:transcriptional regulator with XRE-family HTH domain